MHARHTPEDEAIQNDLDDRVAEHLHDESVEGAQPTRRARKGSLVVLGVSFAIAAAILVGAGIYGGTWAFIVSLLLALLVIILGAWPVLIAVPMRLREETTATREAERETHHVRHV